MQTRILLFLALLLVALPAAAQDATPETTPEPLAGETRVDAFGIEQVFVPAGCFQMGTSDEQGEYALSLDAPSWATRRISSEQAQHEVCLSAGYWIDRTEVTNAAFRAFVEAGGYTNRELWLDRGWQWVQAQDIENLPDPCIEDAAEDWPVVCVTWFEADAYARWRGGALPTEAQWEFAARGTEALIYPWGNEWNPDLANVVDSASLTPVGSYPDGASWVGALDMAGNAMEWVADWLSDGYEPDAATDPTGPESGVLKTEKGGWWGSNAFVARSAYHHFEDPPNYSDHHIGFRIVSPENSEAESG
jgi:formylglycine-generating enzyme required for sulfatase activity